MKIAIIGASAGVGLKCVERALERGHEVITLSRSIQNLPTSKLLTVKKGSATSENDIEDVIKLADAILVTIGTGTSTKATTLYTETAKSLIAVQKRIGTKAPFIVLTGFGAGDSGKYLRLNVKLFFRLFLKKVYENKTQMEELITSTLPNWQIVRPGMLTNNPLSEKYRVETNYFKGMNIGSIARADVADFMIKQAETLTLMGKYPVLSNK